LYERIILKCQVRESVSRLVRYRWSKIAQLSYQSALTEQVYFVTWYDIGSKLDSVI